MGGVEGKDEESRWAEKERSWGGKGKQTALGTSKKQNKKRGEKRE